MLAAALAVAPRHLRWLAPGDKSHRAAQTPALDLVAHVGFPPSEMLRRGYIRPPTGEPRPEGSLSRRCTDVSGLTDVDDARNGLDISVKQSCPQAFTKRIFAGCAGLCRRVRAFRGRRYCFRLAVRRRADLVNAADLSCPTRTCPALGRAAQCSAAGDRDFRLRPQRFPSPSPG
jgi:hypothetical protein